MSTRFIVGDARKPRYTRDVIRLRIARHVMIKLRLFAAAATLAAMPMLATAQTLPASPFDTSRLSQHIKVLSSDAFEGRGPGTAGEVKSVDYIAKQFAAVGLQPAGDNGGWTQAVPLLKSDITGPVSATVAGPGGPTTLAQGEQIAIRAPQMPTTRATIRNAPMVFVGYGVTAPERNWDDYKGLDLRGKVAIALINDPDFEAQAGDPSAGKFDGKSMTYYGRWDYKYAEAARHGAVALLIVHETAPASYGWLTVKNSNTITQFDIVRDDPRKVHPSVEAWIQRDTAADLFRRAGLDYAAMKVAARRADFRPVDLKGETFSTDFAVATSVITSHNVVGKITGAKRPDEVVLYSAHWDHLGVGPADARGDRIYNGALDNASGTAALIELARQFATGPKPERTVAFVAVTAEEKGLLGSAYYAAHPVFPLAKTVADLNLDGLQIAGPARDISVQGNGKSTLEAMIAAAAAKQGRTFTPDPHLEAGHFYRADHFSLAKVGVPSITLEGGLNLYAGGLAAGEAARQEYTANHYHQPADEWRADWDLRGAAIDLAVYNDVGRQLANSRQWPGWQVGSEFKSIRDASAAQRAGS